MSRLSEVQANKEASQTRVCRVAKNATHRAARPGPSQRKKRAAQDDKFSHGLEKGGKSLTACLLHNEPASYSCQQG